MLGLGLVIDHGQLTSLFLVTSDPEFLYPEGDPICKWGEGPGLAVGYFADVCTWLSPTTRGRRLWSG